MEASNSGVRVFPVSPSKRKVSHVVASEASLVQIDAYVVDVVVLKEFRGHPMTLHNCLCM